METWEGQSSYLIGNTGQLLWLSWQSGHFQYQRFAVQNQSSANFYVEHLFMVNWMEKTKLKIKRPNMPHHLQKKHLLVIPQCKDLRCLTSQQLQFVFVPNFWLHLSSCNIQVIKQQVPFSSIFSVFHLILNAFNKSVQNRKFDANNIEIFCQSNP